MMLGTPSTKQRYEEIRVEAVVTTAQLQIRKYKLSLLSIKMFLIKKILKKATLDRKLTLKYLMSRSLLSSTRLSDLSAISMCFCSTLVSVLNQREIDKKSGKTDRIEKITDKSAFCLEQK